MNKNQQIKKLKRELKGQIVLNVLLIVFVATVMFNNFAEMRKYDDLQKIIENDVPDGYTPKIEQVKIDYSKLNKTDVLRAKKIVGELGELYLSYAKSIKFMYNLTDLCGYKCGGFTESPNNNVYVKWNNNLKETKESLCHELLHTVTYTPESNSPYESPLHAIVYDMSSRGICYSHDGDIFWNTYKKSMEAKKA